MGKKSSKFITYTQQLLQIKTGYATNEFKAEDFGVDIQPVHYYDVRVLGWILLLYKDLESRWKNIKEGKEKEIKYDKQEKK